MIFLSILFPELVRISHNIIHLLPIHQFIIKKEKKDSVIIPSSSRDLFEKLDAVILTGTTGSEFT